MYLFDLFTDIVSLKKLFWASGNIDKWPAVVGDLSFKESDNIYMSFHVSLSYWKFYLHFLFLLQVQNPCGSNQQLKWESLDCCSSSKMQESLLMWKNTKGRQWLWTRTVGCIKEHFHVLKSSLKENQLISKHFYDFTWMTKRWWSEVFQYCFFKLLVIRVEYPEVILTFSFVHS